MSGEYTFLVVLFGEYKVGDCGKFKWGGDGWVCDLIKFLLDPAIERTHRDHKSCYGVFSLYEL